MEIRLIISETGSDPLRLEEAADLLRAELLQLEIEDVRTVRASAVPAGARVVNPAAVGALLVVVKESADLVGRVVTAVRSWLRRRPRGQEVELTVGDRTLRLGEASPEQQERLVEEFIRAIAKG